MFGRRIIASFFIASIAIYSFLPPAAVFAQEVAEPQPVEVPAVDPVTPSIPDAAPALPDQATNSDVPKDPPADGDQKPVGDGEAQMSMMQQSDQPQAFPTTAPSTIKHQLPESDAVTGALIYSYPIAVPPGSHGLLPIWRYPH